MYGTPKGTKLSNQICSFSNYHYPFSNGNFTLSKRKFILKRSLPILKWQLYFVKLKSLSQVESEMENEHLALLNKRYIVKKIFSNDHFPFSNGFLPQMTLSKLSDKKYILK